MFAGPRRHVSSALVMVVGGILIAAHPGIGFAADDDRSPIAKLSLFPQKLVIDGSRDSRSVLVTGEGEDGLLRDLSREAELTPLDSGIRIDADGFVVPVKTGQSRVQVTAAGASAELAVEVKDAKSIPVSFVREIIPVTSKVGCNAGTCHGAQQGKNGFKLSLRGYDPLFDYRALVDDIAGRRFNRAVPSQSLILLKPTQGVPHEGGFLFGEDSRYYKLIEQWIAEGCRFEDEQPVAELEVFPKKPLLQRSDDVQQLVVLARYPDGTSRDVTREVVYDTSDFEVAKVDQTGLIQGVRRGEAAALIRYEGLYAAAPITILGEREGYHWKPSPEFGEIDELVNNKLQRMKLLPSGLCTDAEFLRRISLDLTGLPPTPEAARAFVADSRDSRIKREEKIDELLSGPEFIDHWTLKWSDLLLNNRKFVTEKGVWSFRNWIRKSIAENKPYDQFVYEIITASGSTFENPAANYYRIAREPREVMENMTQVFIGTRFQCNQCHDHPFERWTQQQYYELSAYFAGVNRVKGPVAGEEIIVASTAAKPVTHPTTGEKIEPAFPFSHASVDESIPDSRERLARWLIASENPYFAKSLVNRYWSYFFGRGIIDPVDDIRASNPASNPELLAWMTEEFIQSGFDLKELIRSIAMSHTYQRSFRTNEWNQDDDVNFSHAMPRRLTAEQLYDAVITATGAPPKIAGAPAGFRATQLPDPTLDVAFLDMFGRPPRESPCECERSSAVSLSQTLNLINGPTIADAIIHPQGRIAKLAKAEADTDTFIQEIYLAVISRLPTEDEAKSSREYFEQVGDPSEAAQDLMWALINSPAFLFNR